MTVREIFNSYKSVTAIFALLAPAIVIASFWHSNVVARKAAAREALAWYSDDDGKTWFSQDLRIAMPPFDHNGKKAYRAYVFTCDGKTQFVGWLEGYTPETLRMLQQARDAAKNGPPESGTADALRSMGIECKKPGQGQWFNESDSRAKSVRIITCPSGGRVQPVLPE
jgi:hypothetical protein